jgi:hypothetical protein
LYTATLDGTQVVNPDGSMGTGSAATGTMEMQTDEHTLLFDVFHLTVDGISIDDLQGQGPNGTAYHVRLGHADENGPIAIDLGWYVDAGFGTITPTGSGFTVTITGILESIQGLYDMEGTTGLTPEDVLHELEEGHGYVQVHTAAFPDGEIRGALLPEKETPAESSSWGRLKLEYSR